MSEEIKLPEDVSLESAISSLSLALQNVGYNTAIHPEFRKAIDPSKDNPACFHALCALAEEKRLNIPAILAKQSGKKNPAISGE